MKRQTLACLSVHFLYGTILCTYVKLWISSFSLHSWTSQYYQHIWLICMCLYYLVKHTCNYKIVKITNQTNLLNSTYEEPTFKYSKIKQKIPVFESSTFWFSFASLFFFFFFFFFTSDLMLSSFIVSPPLQAPSCFCLFDFLSGLELCFLSWFSGSGIFNPYSASSISSSERKPASEI